MDCAIVLCDWLSLMSVLTEGTVGTSDVFALIRFAKMSRLFRAFALLRMFRLARITDELLDKLFYHEIRIATRVVMILMLVMWAMHINTSKLGDHVPSHRKRACLNGCLVLCFFFLLICHIFDLLRGCCGTTYSSNTCATP